LERRQTLKPYRSYIICATARTGSTLLCKLLSASGVAGVPESYFHQPSISSWVTALNLSGLETVGEGQVLWAVLKAVRQKGTGGTGAFGLRLMRQSFDFLLGRLDVLYPGLANDRERLEAAFGRTLFVHLSRADKVAQAVSLVKAGQTGLWHVAPDGTELERTAPPQEVVYDAEQIEQAFMILAGFDAAWDRWFEKERIEPVRVTYEELSANPTGVLVRVLERLGLQREAAVGVTPGVARLADETSHKWAERFRSESAVWSALH